MATTTQTQATGIRTELTDLAQDDAKKVYEALKSAGVPQSQIADLSPMQLKALAGMDNNTIVKQFQQHLTNAQGNLLTGTDAMKNALSQLAGSASQYKKGAGTIDKSAGTLAKGEGALTTAGKGIQEAADVARGSQSALGQAQGALSKASQVSGKGTDLIQQGAGRIASTGDRATNQQIANEAGILMSSAPVNQQLAAIDQVAAANTRNLTDAVNRNLSEKTLPTLYRKAAGTGNIGSSRSALSEGVARRGAAEELSRGQQNILAQSAAQKANLRQQAFQTGVSSAQQNAARQLQAGTSTVAAGQALGQGSQNQLGIAQGYGNVGAGQLQVAGVLGGLAGRQQNQAGAYGQLASGQRATGASQIGAGQAMDANAAKKAQIGQSLAGLGMTAGQTNAQLQQQNLQNQMIGGQLQQTQQQNVLNNLYNNALAQRQQGAQNLNTFTGALNQIRPLVDQTTQATTNPGAMHSRDYLSLGAGLLGSWMGS